MFRKLGRNLRQVNSKESGEPDAGRGIWLEPGTFLQGRLRCRGTVVLEGTVTDSNIETSANILIAEGAKVDARLSASIVSIRGVFKGTLIADRVEILAGAHVAGNVHVNSVYQDEEAHVEARLTSLSSVGFASQQQFERITPDAVARLSDGPPQPPVEIGT